MKPYTSMMTRPLSSGPVCLRKYGTKKATPPAAEDAKQLTCVPRRVVAYVGRLHKDTTEDALMDFLSGVKLSNLKCRKLSPKEGKKYETAAFMVSCDACTREAFHNEANWPEGCELRDWYFKPKDNNARSNSTTHNG